MTAIQLNFITFGKEIAIFSSDHKLNFFYRFLSFSSTLFAVLICLSVLASIADVGNLVKKSKHDTLKFVQKSLKLRSSRDSNKNELFHYS